MFKPSFKRLQSKPLSIQLCKATEKNRKGVWSAVTKKDSFKIKRQRQGLLSKSQKDLAVDTALKENKLKVLLL
jgi:hypothetical protein